MRVNVIPHVECAAKAHERLFAGPVGDLALLVANVGLAEEEAAGIPLNVVQNGAEVNILDKQLIIPISSLSADADKKY